MNWIILEQGYIVAVGLIGIVTISIMVFSLSSNKFVNSFLLFIFFTACFRLLLRGTFDLGIQHISGDFSPAYRSIFLVTIPLFYLYHKSLVYDYAKFNYRDLQHLIFPFALFVFNFCCLTFEWVSIDKIRVISFASGLIFAIFYLTKSFLILKKELWLKSVDIDLAHFSLMKNWTVFLFTLSLILTVRLIVSLVLEMVSATALNGNTFIIVHATLWLIVFGKILVSPAILFGLPKLNEVHHSHPIESLNLNSHWKIETSEIMNQQDLKLQQKVNPNVLNLIEEIEHLGKIKHYFRNQKISIQDVANELDVPVSHVIYVFKYHCHLTFIEYKNRIKIEDAKNLIESGFLATNTLESLAIEVGFSSYNPFFMAFKKQEGKSPNEYALWIKSKGLNFG
jgi:AraC-like DNA-binding protein